MKEKILIELKKKYSGLSNELLGHIATSMATKVTADDQIQGAIDELDKMPISIPDYAAFLQKDGDKRVSEATRTHEQTLRSKYDFKEKGSGHANDDAKDDVIKTQLATLLKKIDELEKKGEQQALHTEFMSKLSKRKIPAAFAKGRTVESAEQIDSLLDEIEADYNTVKQEMVNEGLGGNEPPAGSSGGGSKVKPASDKELNEAMSNIKI